MTTLTSKMMWRENKNLTEYPAADSVTIHAEDAVANESIYTLVICHVDSFHGKGFMPSVRSGYSPCHNGDVSLGLDWAAYAKAQEQGKQLLQQQIEKLEADSARYDSKS